MLGVCFLRHFGELVPDKEAFNLQRHLSLASLAVVSSSDQSLMVVLCLFKSKMDQKGLGQTWVVTCMCSQLSHLMCPMHVALGQLKWRETQSDLPAGHHLTADCRSGHRSAPPLLLAADRVVLCRVQVVSAIKWLASHLGLDLMWFSSHSLCRGGATSVAAAGLSVVMIQHLGGVLFHLTSLWR